MRPLLHETEPAPPDAVPHDPIRDMVKSLSRPHRTGGMVIERAAVLASGRDAAEILRWISAHAGMPEAETARTSQPRGLHGARFHSEQQAQDRAPLRYLLPRDALA